MVHTLAQIQIGQGLTIKRINQVEPDITKDDITAVNEYMLSGGWITENDLTRELEGKIKDFVDRKYALAVPNGTIAIYLALLGLGIGKGKRVAVPNITMIATINAVIWAGAEPVIVDVDNNFCLSIEKLKDLKNIDAVIFVPLNGRTGSGIEIEEWCSEKGVVLIEDSAHALGSQYSIQRMCGKLGDASIFSFTPHKIITMGQGGIVLTDSDEVIEKIEDLKTFNRKKDASDWHKGYGLNFKLTDLQSALGISQFSRLLSYIENKRELLKVYNSNISEKIGEIKKFKSFETPWFFDLYLEDKTKRDKVASHLKKYGISTRNSYPPLSYQEHLVTIEKTELDFSEKEGEKILWLPSSNSLKEEDVMSITEYINSGF